MDFYEKKLNRTAGIFFFLLFAFSGRTIAAEDFHAVHSRDVEVRFAASLDSAADEVIHLYPDIRRDLEALFRWRLSAKPTVMLVPTRKQFLELSGDALVVAFAMPERNLIVIDYSRTVEHSFSIAATLKHELCHLLLHENVKRELLPKWLDEGLCQWVSDGIGEMVVVPKRTTLLTASLSHRLIPLKELHRAFPVDEKSRSLAYAESRSFVAYLFDRFGRNRCLDALNYMKNGSSADASLRKTFSTSFGQLEKEWRQTLKRRMTWFTFLSYNLYEILFVLMAAVTTLAFIRLYLRKKNRTDDEEAAQWEEQL